MIAQPQQRSRFIRKTTLSESEYDINFQKMDRDIIAAVSSPEADQITPLMSKIYLRLLQTPANCKESERVLRFEGETQEGKWIKAWDQLCKHLRVSSETAHKALSWMHEQGLIGYSAFKNGVGIRIFLNRAASSIGIRTGSGGKKILPFAPAAAGGRLASESETAFKDSFAVREDLDSDINPRAPKNGADNTEVGRTASDLPTASNRDSQANTSPRGMEVTREANAASATIPVDEIVRRLQNVLEPSLKSVALQAAHREHERTREWLDKYGIPKATRVAQKEAYNVLRSHGLMNSSAQRARADLEVGRSSDACTPPETRPRTTEEITEIAETCVALLEAQGKSVELTLSELISEGGGWLLPEEAPRVREAAHRLMIERSERR